MRGNRRQNTVLTTSLNEAPAGAPKRPTLAVPAVQVGQEVTD